MVKGGYKCSTHELSCHGSSLVAQRWVVLYDPLRNKVIELNQVDRSDGITRSRMAKCTANRCLVSPARSRYLLQKASVLKFLLIVFNNDFAVVNLLPLRKVNVDVSGSPF